MIDKEKQKEILNKALDRAIDYFGTTEECLTSSFILPDGSILELRDEEGYHQEHGTIKNIYPQKEISGYASPIHFSKDAPALSLYQFKNNFGLDMNLKSEITQLQWDKLEECVCYHEPKKDKEITYIFYNEKLQTEAGDRVHAENPDDCFKMIDKIKKDYNNKRRLLKYSR